MNTSPLQILLYHLSLEKLSYSHDLIEAKSTSLTTLYEGREISIVAHPDKDSHVLEVNGYAKVVWYPDGLGSNGVLHPIDRVLVPEQQFHDLFEQALKSPSSMPRESSTSDSMHMVKEWVDRELLQDDSLFP